MPEHPTLSNATTPAEILEALARFVWWEDHRMECPKRMIPALSDIIDKKERILGEFALCAFHVKWINDWRSEGKTHPYEQPVRDWQKTRALPVKRNARSDRVMPARLGMADHGDSRTGRLFTPSLHAQDAANESSQLVFPGFGIEGRAARGPVLPLALYDLGAAKKAEHRGGGGGAPLALRLWIEAVLSVPLSQRTGDLPVAMSVTLRDLLARLYPNQRPSPNKYWPRLMAAAQALDSWEARIPWEDPETKRGGLRRIVSVSDIPRGETALDDLVTLTVHLPPGAKDGPILSPRLPLWGVRDARAYRALIGLAFRWHNPGVTRVPVRQGKHWLQTQDANRYERLTDDDVIDLCFPTSAIKNRRVLVQRAWETVRKLVKAGEARLTKDRKLLPPPQE